jgi:heat shock protein HslJ
MQTKIACLLPLVLIAASALAACRSGSDLSVEGTRWTLETSVNQQGEMVDVLPDSEITIELQSGELNGSAGCNRYFGSYELDGDRLTVGPLGATRMTCGDALDGQERQYLAALERAATAKIVRGQLQIADADGKTVLTFVPSEPMSLTGTTWILLFHFNGKDGFVSTLLDTEVTATFGEDGSLTGSAGCNDYTASYEIDGEEISIGPIAATLQMCAEPEGIMEQEGAYLAALESAATYRIEGDTLELIDADGKRMASFAAAP